jgi:hypothetical protein
MIEFRYNLLPNPISLLVGMATKANKDIELLVRVPLLVAFRKVCVWPARAKLLAGSFVFPGPEEKDQQWAK